MKTFMAAAVLLVALFSCSGAQAQDASSLKWQVGPTKGTIDDRASLDVPQGYLFLDDAETRKYVEMSHNLSNGEEYLFAPDSGKWEAYFSFDEIGYVKDNDELDADELLGTLREQQAQANGERRKRGWSPLTITGWRIAPRYNPATRVLEWATLLKDDASGNVSVNYNTRVLGRKGAMSVQLVARPEDFDAGLLAFQQRLGGFHYDAGERYADFRPGDHVAEYGLAALVAGGAAAVAAKKGLFGAIAAFLAGAWKLLVAGALGLGAWLRSLFRRRSA